MPVETKDIKGLLNLIAVASDFEEEYVPTSILNIFLSENKGKQEITKNSGVILKSGRPTGKPYLSINIHDSCFSYLESLINGESREGMLNAPPYHKIVGDMYNFFGIKIILGYGEHFDKDIRQIGSSFVAQKGEEFFCSEIRFGDLLCQHVVSDLPLYVRKELFDEFGSEFENLKF